LIWEPLPPPRPVCKPPVRIQERAPPPASAVLADARTPPPRAPSRGLRESFNPPLAIMALDKNRSRPMLLIAPPQGIPRESALFFLRLASMGPYDAADTRDDGRARPFRGGPGRATRDDRGDQGGTTIGTLGGGEVAAMNKAPGKPQPGKPEPGKPDPWKPDPGKPQPGPR